MRICDGYELVNIADEYMAVPVGEETNNVHGVFVLNEAVYYLLEKMRQDVDKDTLVGLLLDQYDIDREKAFNDVTEMVNGLKEYGLIVE